MWESISSISAIVAVLLCLIFLLLLIDKSVYTKAGMMFQGGILIFAALFGLLHTYVSNNKVEVSTYQYAQVYSLYMDGSKDSVIKSEIRKRLADGIFSKNDLKQLKINHLETLNYADAMMQFTKAMPNIAFEYANSTQKLSINMSVGVVQMMRLVFIMGFALIAIIYMLCWNQYHNAKKLKRDDPISRQNIERWHFMLSKQALKIVSITLTVSVVGLISTELYFNDVTDSTKEIVLNYGEANKNIPMINSTVNAVLADGKITVDEFKEIENLEQEVLINYIKKNILAYS
ncbi:hypothetical protein MUB04_15010 [Acinetobacter indicus]|uniref:hypothetical protein n=1 Tax=Acinetobacter TaxID=469 RepID=UPI0015D1F70E|nr:MULTISPECIES: hypothetical protein [Acinetobacter]MCP0917844.1 hypothetical protein [Acinetobacter indicus]